MLAEVKQFMGAYLQRPGDTLQRIKLRISMPVFHTAELTEIKSRTFSQFLLSHAAFYPQLTDTPIEQYRFFLHTTLPHGLTLDKVFRKLTDYAPNYHSHHGFHPI